MPLENLETWIEVAPYGHHLRDKKMEAETIWSFALGTSYEVLLSGHCLRKVHRTGPKNAELGTGEYGDEQWSCMVPYLPTVSIRIEPIFTLCASGIGKILPPVVESGIGTPR